jgi:hypothetical protein
MQINLTLKKHLSRQGGSPHMQLLYISSYKEPANSDPPKNECNRYVEADLQCCSSHDLIAHLMNIACTVGTDRQNRARAVRQTNLQAQLFSAIDDWHEENNGKVGNTADGAAPALKLPPVEWTYEVMGRFTRLYIQSYMPDPSKDQDVRFVPFLEIDRTHAVHTKALEFQKAQDTIYGKCRLECVRRSYDTMSYAELVQLSVARIMESSWGVGC